MTTTNTRFGLYHHGTPAPDHAGQWVRNDVWTPTDGILTQPAVDRIACDGPADDSPVFSRLLGCQPDADCPCCYLGTPHTQQLHAHYLHALHTAEVAQ
jgi:hypothetical protein